MNSILKLAIRTARAFSDAVFPLRCLSCRQGFTRPENVPERRDVVNAVLNERGLAEDAMRVFGMVMCLHLCPRCIQMFIPVESPFCERCGAPFASREGKGRICGKCIKSESKIGRIRSFGMYEGPLRELIHRLKYDGKIIASHPLNLLLFAGFIRFWGREASGVDLIVPVPLHMKRFRKRGFNQAYLLVRRWEDLYRGAVEEPCFNVARELLVRHRRTESQTGLDRAMRYENVKGAFSSGPGAVIGGKRIVLVDDVYTTGSTANACAEVLFKNGALAVDLLTLARA